ncbi:uncharacterized protein AC631_01158 [Debaryomyces fabryi]|uniref:Oxidoreductase-like domain-containing protein n=1 Tax=Debaryomyces fabryi TaxID=58627 RepID=A0A0V1Q3G2_9ASCO|nr:uncharacterized protein AC631_01158 [Debaryomyces fabryi]KSA03024.1 hypothetical protein AC631_01158 [Debaryomyces fabryi]CUM49231.1 unnamed protein product [Debaryomyces fabryi]
MFRVQGINVVTFSRALSSNSSKNIKSYAFYDLVCRTPTHPREPIEALLMTNRDLQKLKKNTRTTFEGNYAIDDSISPEERIAKVFGGRIKGEAPQSSSRVRVGEPKVIAGITVPDKPTEPDNCCMSGCINCVWELFNDDLKHWNDKRKEASLKLKEKGGRWPENFHAPVKYLDRENLPKSLANADISEENKKPDLDVWGDVPISIKVFVETEKKMKAKKKRRAAASSHAQAS